MASAVKGTSIKLHHHHHHPHQYEHVHYHIMPSEAISELTFNLKHNATWLLYAQTVNSATVDTLHSLYSPDMITNSKSVLQKEGGAHILEIASAEKCLPI